MACRTLSITGTPLTSATRGPQKAIAYYTEPWPSSHAQVSEPARGRPSAGNPGRAGNLWLRGQGPEPRRVQPRMGRRSKGHGDALRAVGTRAPDPTPSPPSPQPPQWGDGTFTADTVRAVLGPAPVRRFRRPLRGCGSETGERGAPPRSHGSPKPSPWALLRRPIRGWACCGSGVEPAPGSDPPSVSRGRTAVLALGATVRHGVLA